MDLLEQKEIDSFFDRIESDPKMKFDEKREEGRIVLRARFPLGPAPLYFVPMISLSDGLNKGYHSWSFRISGNEAVLFGADSAGSTGRQFFDSSELAVRSRRLSRGNQRLKTFQITDKTITIEVYSSERVIVFSLDGEEIERKSFSQKHENIRVGVVGHKNTRLKMMIEEQFDLKPAKQSK